MTDMPDETNVFMCKTDWDYEIGNAAGGNVVYASVEDLKSNRRCVESCGIVEVKVSLVRVIQEEAEYDHE